MRIVFLADARSPIAVNWVRWFVANENETHWISSRPAEAPLQGLASFRVLPIFPEMPAGVRPPTRSRFFHPVAALVRHWLIPFRIAPRARELAGMLAEIKPDVLHAMRIPQEGMVAAAAKDQSAAGWAFPIVISVWGDDFTYHARSSPFMARATRTAMQAADALQADCHRDIRIASDWGLRPGISTLVTPGNGGIRSQLFFQAPADDQLIRRFHLPADAFFILNPRGLRSVARTDTFFQAIPRIRERIPDAHFLALRMEGREEAEAWVRRLHLEGAVTLLPALPPEDMASLFRLSPITLSLTEHDGVPNVLLEAMACGSFPICGNLELIREWIESGINGTLLAPGQVDAVTEAVVHAWKNEGLRRNAAERNRQIIADRGDWAKVMPQVEKFYQDAAGLP